VQLFANVEARTRELAKSVEMLRRERNNKLMNLEAMAASIGHEVAQPLAAIAANGSAAPDFSSMNRQTVIAPARYLTTSALCLERKIGYRSQSM